MGSGCRQLVPDPTQASQHRRSAAADEPSHAPGPRRPQMCPGVKPNHVHHQDLLLVAGGLEEAKTRKGDLRSLPGSPAPSTALRCSSAILLLPPLP